MNLQYLTFYAASGLAALLFFITLLVLTAGSGYAGSGNVNAGKANFSIAEIPHHLLNL